MIRKECFDKMLFFNESDLQNKLDAFKTYNNQTRVHSSLELKTPSEMAANPHAYGTTESKTNEKIVSFDSYEWKSHCHNLYHLPEYA